MTFLSKFEQAASELRKDAARRTAEGPTPEHTRSAAEMADGEDDGEHAAGEARRRRERVQHLADPYPAAAEPDMDKGLGDAYLPAADYPQPAAVSPEDFRRGAVRAGYDALSPGYQPPVPFRSPLPDLADLRSRCP